MCIKVEDLRINNFIGLKIRELTKGLKNESDKSEMGSH